MKNFVPFLTLVFLVGVIAVSTYNLNQKQVAKQDFAGVETGEKISVRFKKVQISLPEFSLSNLYDEDKTFSKNDLVGQYSLINFFASWCTTCRAEHETLLRLHDEKIIKMYGIAWRDIDEKTKDYLKESGNPFDVVAKDSRGLFTKITGIEAVPETLIVDEKGNVVLRYQGNLQEFMIDEIRELTKK